MFENQFVEENIKHTKKDQDDPQKNKTKENSNQINKFDKEDVDPNDIELTMLLEGMAVEKNGKVHKVDSRC